MFKNNKHAKKQGTMSKSLQKTDAVNTPQNALKCLRGPRNSHRNATGWFTFLREPQQHLTSVRL